MQAGSELLPGLRRTAGRPPQRVPGRSEVLPACNCAASSGISSLRQLASGQRGAGAGQAAWTGWPDLAGFPRWAPAMCVLSAHVRAQRALPYPCPCPARYGALVRYSEIYFLEKTPAQLEAEAKRAQQAQQQAQAAAAAQAQPQAAAAAQQQQQQAKDATPEGGAASSAGGGTGGAGAAGGDRAAQQEQAAGAGVAAAGAAAQGKQAGR